MRTSRLLLPLMLLLLLSSCYHKLSPSRFRIVDSLATSRPDTLAKLDSMQIDSLYFAYTHHYTLGFNFVVKGGNLHLTHQQPEEIITGLPVDSFAVERGKHLVVADVRILSADPTDTVWVQVATEDSQFGWAHERQLLHEVDPDDPISQFISIFSNAHLLVFLIVISLIAVLYAVLKLKQGRVKIVHFNDISSFYPSLLALIVAASAAFYASIQMFAPEQWRAFYFNPSLNPFSLPPLLEIFLTLVWSMPIVGLAAVDDAWRKLDARAAVFYVASLLAVCAFNYILFSVSTLYYVGYPLLVGYIVYAVRRYWTHSCVRYYCGNCGAPLRRKGRCPHCGAMNE